MIRRLTLAAAALCALLAALPAQAQALPPHRFFGSLTIDGQPAAAGSVIRAFIGGTECGSFTTTNAGRYQVDVLGAAQQAGCGRGGETITFRVNNRDAAPTGEFRTGGFQQLDLTIGAAQGRFNAAVLDLSDPRPCIPEPGQQACDATRTSLWNGEEAAWRARGVTDPDARFNETVVFRVRASDPAVIGIIARFLEAPYLQVTYVRFIGAAAGQADEYAEVTNLGGGSQEMTGWTLRSPARNAVYNFPDGLVLVPSQACRIYTGPPRADSCGQTSFNATDVWPDDAGQVVLFYDALALPGADVRYSADPGRQPPAPNLRGVVEP